MTKVDVFLGYWKKAVLKAGQDYFGPKDCESATEIVDLQPKQDRIRDSIGVISSGEQKFMVAIVSFYDGAFAMELANKIKCDNSVAGLLCYLDDERKDIVSNLVKYYSGW